MVWVKLGGSFYHHAKSTSTTATESKEDVLVLASVGRYVCSVGQHDFHLLGIIHAETKRRREDAVATAGNPSPGRSDSGT